MASTHTGVTLSFLVVLVPALESVFGNILRTLSRSKGTIPHFLKSYTSLLQENRTIVSKDQETYLWVEKPHLFLDSSSTLPIYYAKWLGEVGQVTREKYEFYIYFITQFDQIE